MAPNFLTGGSNSCIKYFEIRTDGDHLVLRGSASEAPSVVLRGKLVLCLLEPLKVQDIHMRFTGEAKKSFHLAVASGNRFPKQEYEFYRHTWTFVCPEKKYGQTLAAGNYEWPFELVINGDFPETIEGMNHTWIVYRMKATIDRGLLAKDVYARQHVRLIRTFDASSLELSHNMSVENIWPNKIAYDISTPTKGVVFGTSVHLDYTLIPLLKGLKIGKISCELWEEANVTIELKGEPPRKDRRDRKVSSDQYELPENAEIEDIDGQDGYKLHRELQVPRSLRKCVQTVEELRIKIKHRLQFVVSLHNPDGHTSELRATLPIHIFISPNLRISDNFEALNEAPRTAEIMGGEAVAAPPLYGDHQYDQLYAGLDSTGYMTPGPSGANTPFYNMSRRGSSDNVTPIDTIPDTDLSANTLRNRLHNIGLSTGRSHRTTFSRSQPSGASIPAIDISDVDPPRNNSTSTTSSGRTSTDPPTPNDPEHIEYNAEALCRVPSYNTAVQPSAAMICTPSNTDLPNYQQATSTPPSPPTSPQRSYSSPSLLSSATVPVQNGTRHVLFADQSFRGEGASNTSDRERRLRILQARGR